MALLVVLGVAAVALVAGGPGDGPSRFGMVGGLAEEPAATATPEPAPTTEPEPAAAEPAPTSTVGAEEPAALAEPTPAAEPEPSAEPADDAALTAPFLGLSTWIDIYDVDWTPQEQVDVAAAAGVDVIFLQSARHLSEADIDDAERFAAVLDAAKARGLKVIAWYIPDFMDPERDLRRARAAISFTTPAGNRADGFGLDIELDDQADLAVRNARLLELSAQLREDVGPDYPLAAVVLPPLQLDLNQTWWPDFPYAALTEYYDVFVPMSYSSYRGTDAETTYRWNLDNVLETRRRAGVPDLPVHLAGGIADNLPEVEAFVRAAVDGQTLGAGLYDLQTTTIEAWADLAALSLTGPRGTLRPRGDG